MSARDDVLFLVLQWSYDCYYLQAGGPELSNLRRQPLLLPQTLHKA